MNVEREILNALKAVLNNKKLKVADLQEWSSTEDSVRKNLREDIEVYVTCTVLDMTWHCAVLKTADKRKKENPDGN